MPVNQDKKVKTTKGEKTGQRILDAAEQLFSESGFAGTSIRDVTALAGIQKASFYNHFTSKDALYSAVLERGFAPMLQIMVDFTEQGEKAYENPQLPATFFELMATMPSFARLLQFESLQGGARLKPLLAQWVGEGLAKGEQAMKGSRHGKYWQPEELRLLSFYTFTMILGYFTLQPLYELYTDEEPMTPASIERQKTFLSRLWQQIWYQNS